MKEVLSILSQYLNIDLSDRNTIAIIDAELKNLPGGEVAPFIAYVKEKCNDKSLEYKTGFQKFNYLIDRFKLHRVQLSEDENNKIYNYKETLSSSVEGIFELIEAELYSQSITPTSERAKAYLNSTAISQYILNYIDEKGLKVIDKIGRGEVCRLVRHNRYSLKKKIEQTITDLTKEKKILTLGYSGAIANQLTQQKMIGG